MDSLGNPDPLNADLSGQSMFVFRAKTDSVAHEMDIRFELTDGTGHTSVGDATVQSLDWTDIQVSFSSMTTDAGFNWGDVDKIKMILQPEQAGNDANIDWICADVPEPTTMAILALGGLGLMRRRRHRRANS